MIYHNVSSYFYDLSHQPSVIQRIAVTLRLAFSSSDSVFFFLDFHVASKSISNHLFF